jgi:uncharacterized protein (TIGR03663 family)
MSSRGARAWVRSKPALVGVLAAAVLALTARLYALGWRMAHWDEGRVAFRVLEYARDGAWHYRPVVHGPFLFQVNHRVFDLLGPSDFAMRLVVALVGGLLPLSAWLFRERLRDSEVVALALFLAANPVLLYYSRFMRNDLLLAAFAFTAVGFAVRALDTGARRHLYAAAGAFALAVTTKEFVLVDAIAWGCGLALLADRRLLVARARGRGWAETGRNLARRAVDGLRAWAAPLGIAVLEFFLVVVFFYAPRPDLWNAFADPAAFPGVVRAATLGSWDAFVSMWLAGGHQDHAYLPYALDYLRVVRAGALPLVLFAAAGYVVDRYTGERDVVAFATYWGVLAALVYPLASDITPAPWGVVHAAVPLALPAAVGVALVYRRGRAALAADDRVGVALAAVLLLLVAGQVGATAVSTSYVRPQENTELVQFGQPSDSMKPAFGDVERAVGANAPGEVDVMFYGSHFTNWAWRLPLPWYFLAMNATTGHTADVEAMQRVGTPPVVLARERHAENLSAALDGYRRYGPYAITLEIPGNVVRVVIFVDRSALADAGAPPSAAPTADRRPPTADRRPLTADRQLGGI